MDVEVAWGDGVMKTLDSYSDDDVITNGVDRIED